MPQTAPSALTVTFAGSGDAFGSGGRYQACIHLRPEGGDHFGGLPFLILDGQFSRRTAPLAVVGPPGTAQRLADTMECLFPGSSTIAYTGDTAWTDSISDAAADADLLIAEAYYRDKDIPYHLSLADLDAHRDRLTPRRGIITHMSADMLGADHATSFEKAHDGLIVGL